MKLIDTWRHDALKLWSVRIAFGQAVLGAGATAYAFYTPGQRVWPPILVFIVGVVLIVARLVRQKGVGNGDSE